MTPEAPMMNQSSLIKDLSLAHEDLLINIPKVFDVHPKTSLSCEEIKVIVENPARASVWRTNSIIRDFDDGYSFQPKSPWLLIRGRVGKCTNMSKLAERKNRIAL